jgi:hypothetical protein
MAFRRDFLKIVLPIPDFVESHDLWLAIASNIMQSNLHFESMTVIRRLHGNNLTNSNRSIIKKIKSRIIHIISILILLYRKHSCNAKN